MTDSRAPLVPAPRPLLTADLPGTGGELRSPADFEVEEIPAYLPVGDGQHCLVLIEKRELTTPEAIDRLCRAAGVPRGQAGYAGLKDKVAVTRQWISLEGARPEALLALDLGPELRVLRAALHRNKLRTGHLRGNRFTITLHGVHPEGEARAARVLALLEARGLPNFYGEQRFGREGDNALQGARILRGEIPAPRDKFRKRLLLSSLQSFLFNEVLAERLAPGGPGHDQLLGGEVLQLAGSSALFVSDDRETDSSRLRAGEVLITGPICGPRMPWPQEGSPARELEERVLSRHEVTTSDFGRMGRLTRGGRRPLAALLTEVSVEGLPPDGLRLRFALPPGSYATVLLREVSKGDLPR